MKNLIAKIIIGVLIFAAAFFLLTRGSASNVKKIDWNNAIIYFWGSTCPHCKNVKKFIGDNKVHNKFQFEELEVYENADNQARLAEAAKKCLLDANKIGVPFLFAKGKCFEGKVEVINYFKNRLGKWLFRWFIVLLLKFLAIGQLNNGTMILVKKAVSDSAIARDYLFCCTSIRARRLSGLHGGNWSGSWAFKVVWNKRYNFRLMDRRIYFLLEYLDIELATQKTC